jgi:hypothetical protein
MARVQGLEAYFMVRMELVRSHAVLSICQYILG